MDLAKFLFIWQNHIFYSMHRSSFCTLCFFRFIRNCTIRKDEANSIIGIFGKFNSAGTSVKDVWFCSGFGF